LIILFRNAQQYQQTIGVHPDYKIPLVFPKEETQWQYAYPDTPADKTRGMLCPHIYIRDCKGNTLSLRELPEHLFKKFVEYKHSNPELFYIILSFKQDESTIDKEKINEVLKKEPIQAKKVYIKLLNKEESSKIEDIEEHEAIFSTDDLEKLLERLSCDASRTVIIRSDATVIGVL